MSATPKAWAIAALNLRRLFRDRTGAFFVLVFPFLIILALGATFGGAATPTVGVVHPDTPLADDLVHRLDASDDIDTEPFEDAATLRAKNALEISRES